MLSFQHCFLHTRARVGFPALGLICSSRLKLNTMPWDQVPSSAEFGQEEMFLVLAQLVAAMGEFVFTPNSWLTSLLGAKESQGLISETKGFTLAIVLPRDMLLLFSGCVFPVLASLEHKHKYFASSPLLCTTSGFKRLACICFLLSLNHRTSGAGLHSSCLALIARTLILLVLVTGVLLSMYFCFRLTSKFKEQHIWNAGLKTPRFCFFFFFSLKPIFLHAVQWYQAKNSPGSVWFLTSHCTGNWEPSWGPGAQPGTSLNTEPVSMCGNETITLGL